ncbi:prepilin peptidase [Brevibacterium sp. SIMBA_078]|uniref:prepilin peptidase n=2 Tax=unclassified Brevibacterium TaxID=2614124 RepID=UPI003978B737
MNTGVLHGMTIGVTVLAALACGLILAVTPRTWLNDSAHLQRWQSSRWARGPGPMLLGPIIAAAVAVVFTLFVLAPLETGWSAYAPLDGATFAPDQPNSADRILSALLLGLVSGATPFLISADLSVRRLPDRIVIPLSLVAVGLLITGSVLGELPMWFWSFFAGILGLVAFAALHLVGRLLGVRTMGLGDVKLAFIVFAVPGLFDPWAPALVLVAMMLISGVWALIGAIRAGRVRGVTIAFGPAMLSGMWLGCLFAPILL